MRITPIVTALIVVAALYALVLERDRVVEFAGIAPAESSDTEATTVEPIADESVETQTRVSIVALPSVAQEIDTAVILRGRTEPLREVDVTAEVEGTVISPPLRRGARIEAGQALCELDRGTFDVALLEAQARLQEAEINATAASRLAEGGFGSETRRAAANATLEAARAELRRAEDNIKDLVITAPFQGVLEDDTAEFGILLSPNSPGGAQCARILQLNPIKIVGFVPEMQVNRVAEGAMAQARLADGRVATGTVSFLSRSADETTRTFRVEITVPNDDLSIRAGQTAEVGVATDGAIAHLLPASALTLDDGGRLGVRHVVETDAGPEAAFAPVRIIRDTVDGIWLGGLPETLNVIVVGQDFVTAGTPLTVTLRGPDT